MITWWFVPHPGRLGSLLATDNQKGAGWYFYQWYGDMTGDMVEVNPPNDNSNQIDGAACVDSSKEYVSFILGGPNDGSITANFKNIPSFIGSTANVKVEKVDWRNKDTVSNGPNTIFEKKYSVSNGQLSINIQGTNGSSGYHVYITKGDGSADTVEPHDTTTPSNFEGTFKTLTVIVVNVQEYSTSNGANVIQWTDNDKISQQWKISKQGNGFNIINVNANKALYVEENSVKDGGNVFLWT